MTDHYDEGEMPNEDSMNEADPYLELPPEDGALMASGGSFQMGGPHTSYENPGIQI